MALRLSSSYWRWVVACTAGELVGFGGIPVLAGFATLSLTSGLAPELRTLVIYLVSVAAGLGEGAVLAWFQLLVLRACLPRLDATKWISFTALAAAFAWLLGMLVPTLDDLVGLSPGAQIMLWIPAGMLILLSIGTAQSWVLRGIVRKPWRWLTANALGWLLGLLWTFVLPGVLPADAPPSAWLAIFVVAGILMGLTVGLVTGRALVKLETVR